MAKIPEYIVDVDRYTGDLVSGWPRIKQSIETILTTRLRTRIMRLWWGSSFLDMQDKPANEETVMDGIMAAAEAINEHEPEFGVRRIIIEELDASGTITITVEGVDLVEQQIRRVKTIL